MSNECFIDKYKKEVLLIYDVLCEVNVTQAERIKRIYTNAFENRLFSDQTFFESVNWYAKKVINIASQRSLKASRKYEVLKVRYWNSVIIALTPLLGDRPWYDVDSMRNQLQDML